MTQMSFEIPGLPALVIASDGNRVIGVQWARGRRSRSKVTSGRHRLSPLLEQCHRDLTAYTAGRPVHFDWPFDWEQGTAFEQEVWRALQRVPYGETRSYQWVAEQIGRPRAVRAVGNANGKNPFSLVVPCHRIIQKNGQIGGYTGGVAIKRTLLRREGADA